MFNFYTYYNVHKGYGVYKASNSAGAEDKEARLWN